MRGHGLVDDRIEIIHVCNKHSLYTFERVGREDAGDVGIHGASYGISKHGKAEHILHSTDFLGGDMQSTLACVAIMLDCILRVEALLDWCRRMCPLLVAVKHGRWFFINTGVRLGMVAISSLRSSVPKSADAGREHMI